MNYYVVISEDGTDTFYDTAIHSTIPSGALAVSDADYTKFFSDNGKYYFSNNNGTAKLNTYTDVYCYYNNGLSSKTVNNLYAAQTGEVLFSATPTTAQLTAAFSGYAATILAQAKITAETPIKSLLSDTDYEAIKYAEGEITVEQYSALKSARAAWRTAIRSIEACTTVDAVSAVTYSTDIPSVE